MRFAGSRIEGFLGDSPDMGAMAQKAGAMKSQEKAAYTGLQGKVASAGIGAAAEVESAGIIGAAQASAAADQATGSMFSALGQIGGAALGTFGSSSWNKGVEGNDFNALSQADKELTMTNFGNDMASWFK